MCLCVSSQLGSVPGSKRALVGVSHLDPSVLHVDAVSLAEESGDVNSICTRDLTGGEYRVSGRDRALERHWEGGVEVAEDGHNALEGGIQISMSISGCAQALHTPVSDSGAWAVGWLPPLVEGCGAGVALPPPLPWCPG